MQEEVQGEINEGMPGFSSEISKSIPGRALERISARNLLRKPWKSEWRNQYINARISGGIFYGIPEKNIIGEFLEWIPSEILKENPRKINEGIPEIILKGIPE